MCSRSKYIKTKERHISFDAATVVSRLNAGLPSFFYYIQCEKPRWLRKIMVEGRPIYFLFLHKHKICNVFWYLPTFSLKPQWYTLHWPRLSGRQYYIWTQESWNKFDFVLQFLVDFEILIKVLTLEKLTSKWYIWNLCNTRRNSSLAASIQ